MGLLSLVLAIVGVCLSWLPYVGVLALVLGLAAMFFGLLITTKVEAKEGHWQYGSSGLILAYFAVALSLVYRQKFGDGSFDFLLVSIDMTLAVLVGVACVLGVVGSVLFARKKQRGLGVVVAAFAFLMLCLVSFWTLVDLDKTHDGIAKACTIIRL